MKSLNSVQINIIRVSSLILVLLTFLDVLDGISYLRIMAGYLFNNGFLSSVAVVVWLLSKPVNLILALGVLILSFTKKTNLLAKAGAVLVAIMLLLNLLRLIVRALQDNFDVIGIFHFVRFLLIGSDAYLSHFIVILGNICYLAITGAIAFGFLTKNSSNLLASSPVAKTFAVQTPQPLASPVASSTNPTTDLSELVKMFEAGHLTQAEFKAAKKKILE